MAKASEIIIRIGADTYKLEKSLKDSEKSLKKSVKKMGEIGSNLTRSLTLPIAGVGAAAVASFAKFEKLNKALIAVSGSSDKAKVELEQLRDAAKLPGLNFEEAVRGSVRLQAVGLSADDARKSLITFGTAIAASGGGAENLERVVYQLTQMISKNRILQEDFGIIQENIPLIGGALEKAFGSTNIEAIRATGISAQEFNQRLVDALAELPALQADLSSVSNSWENLKVAISEALIEFGKAINETFNLQGLFDGLGDAIRAAAINFKNLDENTKATIVRITAIVVAIGPAIVIISKFRLAILALGTGFSAAAKAIPTAARAIASAAAIIATPWGLVVAAVAGGFIYLFNQSETFKNAMIGLTNVINQVAIESSRVFRGIGAAIKLALTLNISGAAEILKTTFSEDAGSGIGAAWKRGFEDGISDISLDPLKKKIDDVKNSIKSFFTLPEAAGDLGTTGGGGGGGGTGFGGGGRQIQPLIEIPSLEPLQLFREELESLNEVQLRTIEIGNAVSESYGGVAKLLNAASSAVTNAATSGESSFKKLGQAALKAAADVARAALIEVVTTALADSFKKLGLLALPLAAGIAGLAGGVFNSILKGLKIPALASGGLAFSPTLAVVGDNAGAGADPEVIAPLSKLKQYLGSGNQVMGTFRIAGRDLELVLERSQNDSSRVSPI